jgi:hypothetical protein
MSWIKSLQAQCAAHSRPMLVLQPDGTVEARQNSGYEALRAGVGGDIERLVLPGLGTMWCHEQGLLLRLPVNWMAGRLAEQAWKQQGALLAGPVCITGDEQDGEDTPVQPEAVRAVADLLARRELCTVVWFMGASHA